MPVRHSVRTGGVVAAVALAVTAIASQAAAQPATGSVTGRVVWGSCLRALPLPPMATDEPQVQPDGPLRPVPVPRQQGLPAGAVLVAAQNTSISARTDEAGRFTLSGIPAGQYLTIAAGPVAEANVAVAARPNVLVNGAQSVDIGTLSLGGTSPLGVACRFPFDAPTTTTEPAMPDTPVEPPAP
jgi:hypothetical protein